MDCEPPFRYDDYERFLACQTGLSQEVREMLVERCANDQDSVVLDTIEVSGVVYSISAKCADIHDQEDQSTSVDEVTE